jgi:hypothetical protein
MYIDKIRINFQKIIISCQIEFGEKRPFHKPSELKQNKILHSVKLCFSEIQSNSSYALRYI